MSYAFVAFRQQKRLCLLCWHFIVSWRTALFCRCGLRPFTRMETWRHLRVRWPSVGLANLPLPSTVHFGANLAPRDRGLFKFFYWEISVTAASIKLIFPTLRICKSIWLLLFIVLYFVFPRYSRFFFCVSGFCSSLPVYSCPGFLLFWLWLPRLHRGKVLLQSGPAELEYAAPSVLWVLFVNDLSELLSLTICNSSSRCTPAVCHVISPEHLEWRGPR